MAEQDNEFFGELFDDKAEPEKQESEKQKPYKDENIVETPIGTKEEKQPQEAEPEEDELSDVDNPKSYKFFQSKFNKTDAELRKEREDKAVLTADKERLAKELEALKTPKVEPEKPLIKPVKPQKPANYDESDALTDPNSISFQYRASHEQYRDDMIEYQAQLVAKQGEMFKSTQVKLQEAEAEKQSNMELKAFKEKYVAEQELKGTPRAKAEQVFEWVKQQESLDPENWEMYYDAKHNTKPNEKVNNLRKRGEKMANHPPPPIGGDPPKSPDNEQDEFDHLFSTGKSYSDLHAK